MLSRQHPRARRARAAALGAVVLTTGLLAPETALAAYTSPPGSGVYYPPIDTLKAQNWPTWNYVGDMADAAVYQENGTYYAYTTASNGNYVPVLTSTDGMKSWQTRQSYVGGPVAPNGVATHDNGNGMFNDALLGAPKWIQGWPGSNFSVNPNACMSNGTFKPNPACTNVVAPSVIKVPAGQPGAGKYLMTYATFAKTPDGHVRKSITTAIASNPAGPFVDWSSKPFYTGLYQEGAIDPSLFVDPASGKVYLQWMDQGNYPAGQPYDSKIWSQQISVPANGVVTAVGAKAQLLSSNNAQPWERDANGNLNVVEQPSMVRYGNRYYLFYSADRWTTADYQMGYALCAGPMGPCTRDTTVFNPLMASSTPWNQDGPGGGSVFVDANGTLRAVYYAWPKGKPGPPPSVVPDRQRFGHIAALEQDAAGHLTVAQRSLALAPTGCYSPNLFPKANWVDMSQCQYPADGPKVGARTANQPEFTRVGWPDRFEVSAMTSRRAGFPAGGEVIIANGENFPDALAAGPYSAGKAPVLLVPGQGTSLPAQTKAELQRLAPSKVTIAGSPGAVSATMASLVQQVTGKTPVRLQGADRYATAAALSTKPSGTTIYVASGVNFPDALAGGVAASKANAPLLLTAPTSLPTPTANAIKARAAGVGVTNVVLLGSSAVVSQAVADQIKALVPNATITRLAGADRYATAAAINKSAFPNAGANAVVVSGTNYPDALSAVPFATKTGSELLLTDPACMPGVIRTEVDRQRPMLTTAVGGPSAVSDKALLHGVC